MANGSICSGPWEVSGGTGIWATSPWNARVKIAEVTVFSPMNGVDWKAHAHLMAAAPDLLAALKSSRGWVEHWQADKAAGLAPTEASLADALASIDAALAKAVAP